MKLLHEASLQILQFQGAVITGPVNSVLVFFSPGQNIVHDGVERGDEEEGQDGGKGQSPDDGVGQGGPVGRLAAQADGHGQQSGNGGDGG